MSVYYIYGALFLCFLSVVLFFSSVYCLCYEELGNITGSRDKKTHPCGRKRAQSYQLFISFFAPLKQRTSESNTPQKLLLSKVTRVLYKGNDEDKT